jgi:DNA-binding response OmpR family regulator
MRILLVDDDIALCELLTEYLQGDGFEVVAVHDGNAALAYVDSGWDAIILDVMLPGMNGFDLLKAIRLTSDSPVLMLTARGEDTDTVLGLELGADDYVTKPVSPRVLVARLRALTRRNAADSHGGQLIVGDLQLDEQSRQLLVSGKPVALTGAEFNLLALLIKEAGKVVSRERLAAEGLGRPLMASDRRIETHMAQVRRKLGPMDDGSPRIQTVRGAGYQYLVNG